MRILYTFVASALLFSILNVQALGGKSVDQLPPVSRSEFVPGPNPFFRHLNIQKREEIGEQPGTQEFTPALFSINGYSVTSTRRVCTINGKQFEAGEQQTVNTSLGKLLIQCVKITDESAVILLTNGVRLQLPLPRK